MRTNSILFAAILLTFLMITQCKKINTEDENRKQNRIEDVLASTVSGSNSENLICEPTNVDLLGIFFVRLWSNSSNG